MKVFSAMHDIAAHYASAIDKEFGAPVDAIGISTGGSVALQLAIDTPGAINRLVLAGAACTLGPAGRAAQRNLAQHARDGSLRRGYKEMGALSAGSGWGRTLGGALGWALGPVLFGAPADPTDGIRDARLLLRPKLGHVAAIAGRAFARDALAHFDVH